ncbi:MAG: MBL fold metallo-hydrolase [Solobacterium sp.]|nr:MBL fold metallo-hydrolase [Solobacterium sp.]
MPDIAQPAKNALRNLITGLNDPVSNPGELRISILDIGKADAIVCECGSFSLVIDAGTRQNGKTITRFLKQKNIRSIDCLIITHYDRDHVGGAIDLVLNFPIRRIILPDYEPGHPDAVEFLRTLEEKEIIPEQLNEPCSFRTGFLHVLIEPPLTYDTKRNTDYDNDLSLITTITHEGRRLVFGADMEKKRISEWLKTDPAPCTFLKFPHHGVYEKALKDLMKALQPDHVAICDSKNAPADKATLRLIEKYTDSVCQTRDGMITVLSNFDGITMRQQKRK